MKKYLSLIGTLALVLSFASTPTAEAARASDFDNQLKITERLNAGTLLKDVERVHTVTVNGKTFVVEKNVNANMSHLRHLSVCSVTPKNCKGENATWAN